MGTIALFITVFILLCIFALIFVCYRAGRDGRQQALSDEDAASMRRATIVLSIVPGSAAATAFAAQQHTHVPRPRPTINRKTPTPPTIIRNLPVVIWDKPKAAPAPAADTDTSKDVGDASYSKADDSSDGKETMCVICCCDYEAGEQVKLLPCLHMYHQFCIDAWLERSHVCPVCQADVIRAAGLSAAAGDWSEHTQQAVNVISGVQPHNSTTSLYPDTDMQQQHQQQHGSIPEYLSSQQQQQQDTVVLIPDLQASHWSPQLPISTSPSANGTAAAAPAAAAPTQPPPAAAAAAAAFRSQGMPSGGGHSTDAVALVVTRPAEGTCSSRA